MRIQIVQLINEIVSAKTIKTSISITSVIKKNSNMIDFLNKEYGSIPLIEQCWLIFNNSEIPICKVCGKTPKFQNWFHGYGEFCSISCSSKFSVPKSEYQKNRIIKEFDVSCIVCGKIFKTKKKNRIACSKSCGAIHNHAVRSEEDKIKIDIKRKKTCNEKYGDDYVVNSEYSRLKTEYKIGVKYPYNSKVVRDKSKATLFQNHGVDNPMKAKIFVKKMMSTKIKKYGDLLTPCFRYKDYTFPSGKTVKVQGYENKAIDILLKSYNESDIIIGRGNIEKYIGKIEYSDINGNTRSYYPDIYIVSINKVIEVKSQYTFDIHKLNNIQKKNAILSNNIDFEFMILNI